MSVLTVSSCFLSAMTFLKLLVGVLVGFWSRVCQIMSTVAQVIGPLDPPSQLIQQITTSSRLHQMSEISFTSGVNPVSKRWPWQQRPPLDIGHWVSLSKSCWVSVITSEVERRCQCKHTHGCRSWVNTAVYRCSRTARFPLQPVNNFCSFSAKETRMKISPVSLPTWEEQAPGAPSEYPSPSCDDGHTEEILNCLVFSIRSTNLSLRKEMHHRNDSKSNGRRVKWAHQSWGTLRKLVSALKHQFFFSTASMC